MKKVTNRLETSSSSGPINHEDEDTGGLSFLINRPEAVGSSGLAQNSNFFQKLQLAQNSLRNQEEVVRRPGTVLDIPAPVSPARLTDSFLPLSGPAAAPVKSIQGAVFPQELDILTAGNESPQFGPGGGGLFQDFEFEEEPEEVQRPGQKNLFRVSSQLQVGEEGEGEGLRFPGTVLEDATTRKIGNFFTKTLSDSFLRL
jgi:hypothetical protein